MLIITYVKGSENSKDDVKLKHTKIEPVPQLVLSYIHLALLMMLNNCEDAPLRI